MILLLGCLLMAAVQDIRSGKVSNRLIAAGLMIGSFFQIRNYQICGMYYFLRNVSIPVILLYLLFQMRVLGAGDIKLFSMIGSFLTMQELLKCMAYSFLAAGAGAVLFLAADKRRRQRIRQGILYLFYTIRTGKITQYEPVFKEEQFSFAFSVPVLFGTICTLYF